MDLVAAPVGLICDKDAPAPRPGQRVAGNRRGIDERAQQYADAVSDVDSVIGHLGRGARHIDARGRSCDRDGVAGRDGAIANQR